MNTLTQIEFARIGGNKVLKKYGKKHFSEMGKKGAMANIKKYGTDFFKKLSLAGVEARKAKRDASRTVIEKIKDAILPPQPPTE